jgi:hypothetical protein
MLRSGLVRGGSGLRLGIVTDPHLEVAGTSSPSVLGFPSVPAEYERDEYVMRYRHALQRCVREDVDGVVLLGDLSRSGDDETLRAGVRLGVPHGGAGRDHAPLLRVRRGSDHGPYTAGAGRLVVREPFPDSVAPATGMGLRGVAVVLRGVS